MIGRWRPELILLAIAAFLAPLIGGHVPLDPAPILEGIFGEIFAGSALVLTSRFVVGLLIFGGLAFVLLRQRVVVVPNFRLSASLVALVTCLGLTALWSRFPAASESAWLLWVLYAAAFGLTVAAVGRKRGVEAVLTLICLSVSLVALKGIAEYAQIFRQEPTYRIFAGWNNPNAVAGMLGLGVPLTIGLALTAKSPSTRFGWLAAASLQCLAVGLTQSKGGYLALAVGLVAMVGFALAWRGGRSVGWAAAPVLVAVIALFGIQRLAAAPGSGGGALTRIVASGSSAEQSVGFRAALWKGTLLLAKENPQGLGIGTYRYYSAKPGLTEQTALSHQTFLQLAAEGGWASLVLLGLFGGFWFAAVCRGARSLPPERNLLRAATVGAIVAVGAHGFIESNLWFWGLGVTTFVVMGVAVQLSADASAPELFPRGLRLGMAAVAGLAPLAMSAFGVQKEMSKAAVMSAIARQDVVAVQAGLAALPEDAEGLAMRGTYGPPDDPRAVEWLERSARLAPTTRTLRALARKARQSNPTSPLVVTSLQQALEFDPNNLRTLTELYLSQKDLVLEDAIATARRLVDVEKASSYRLRALPEFIPTETFEARLFLAEHEVDAAAKCDLLRAAVEGYLRYAEITLPQIKRFEDAGMQAPGADTMAEAREKLARAAKAARELNALYSGASDTAGVRFAEEAATKLEDAGA